MDLRATHKLERFGGVDNVSDLTDMTMISKEFGTFYFSPTADNIDINDNSLITRRDGYRVVYTAGNEIHSLWSDDLDCFFVSGTTLYRLNEDYSSTVLHTGLSGRPVVFASAFGDTYFTDGVYIGYISKFTSTAVTILPAVTDLFKSSMPAGHAMTFYRNVLYVAVNDIVFCSDPLKIRQYDVRFGMIPQFGYITMLQSLDNAIWISDDKSIYCWLGTSHYDFTNRKKSDFPVLINSSTVALSENTMLESDGKSVIMATKYGFYAGTNDGSLVALTKKRYHIPSTFSPVSMGVRWSKETHQCLLAGNVYPSIDGAHIMISTPPLDILTQTYQPWSLPSLIVSLTGTTA
jgi:hypothetical protein